VIAERVAAVRERIARAAARATRDPAGVSLVAVSKTQPAEAVREAFAAGVRDFGENRVQEAEAKIAALAELRAEMRWHLVGHLQGNKARKAVALFDRVHSVDSVELARRLAAAAAERGSVCRVLLQVDLAGEATKFGLEADALDGALSELAALPALAVLGLMLVPPYDADPERVRPLFRRLRELRDAARERGLSLGGELSMGMSHDLEVAVEEGATLVRIGTAIFGARAPAGGAV
jgi:pyridoxal phosphate enzyme (YggS family)